MLAVLIIIAILLFIIVLQLRLVTINQGVQIAQQYEINAGRNRKPTMNGRSII